MDYLNYSSVGEWFKDASNAGYFVPVAMMRGISDFMRENGIGFVEAFRLLEEGGRILLVGNVYVFGV